MNYGHYDEIWDEQAREAGESRKASYLSTHNRAARKPEARE